MTGSLTVPGAAQDTVSGVISANDYLLTEPSPPPGWTLESITCDVLDPATGARSSVAGTTGGTFPVAPGYTTVCTITNSGPATLTIVKATVPQGASQTFAFTGTRPGGDPVTPFTLSDGTSHQIPVTPGDTLTITEAATTDWALQTLDCAGDDEVVTDPGTGTATVSIDPGEQVVCTFVNADNGRDPARAYLLVEKAVPEPDGTGFDFTVRGPLTDSSFTLTPPDPARHLEVLNPAADGSTYAVAETVPTGWELQSRDVPLDRGIGGHPRTLRCDLRRHAAQPGHVLPLHQRARATTRSPDHHQGHDARRWGTVRLHHRRSRPGRFLPG